MFEYISQKEQDTIMLAKKIASNLKIGDIIILTGDLGARKN